MIEQPTVVPRRGALAGILLGALALSALISSSAFDGRDAMTGSYASGWRANELEGRGNAAYNEQPAYNGRQAYRNERPAYQHEPPAYRQEHKGGAFDSEWREDADSRWDEDVDTAEADFDSAEADLESDADSAHHDLLTHMANGAAEMHAAVADAFANETDCVPKPLNGIAQGMLDELVQGVVGMVPDSELGSSVKAKVTVAFVTTAITNISISLLKVAQVKMSTCDGVTSKIMLNITGINMTMSMDIDEGGLFGVGAMKGKARSTVNGSLTLNIDDLEKASHCHGDLHVGPTVLKVPEGEVGMSGTPIPLPIGAILCYGPDAIPGGQLANVELEGTHSSGVKGEHSFRGLVRMIDDALGHANIMKNMHNGAKEVHAEMAKGAAAMHKGASEMAKDMGEMAKFVFEEEEEVDEEVDKEEEW